MAAGTRKATSQAATAIARRPSTDTPTKSNELNETMMDEIRRMHSETNLQIQNSKDELKLELKTETSEITARLDKIDEDLKSISDKVKKLEVEAKKTETKVETVCKEQQEIQEAILRLQLKQRENCIKLRGLPEKPNENLYTYLVPILAKFVNESETLFPWEVDRIYRINSRVAKMKQLPRDVVIYFVRKQTKDLILQQSFKTKLKIEDKEITVMRDIPGKILKRRKEYCFLLERLKSCGIPYKWEEIEGVVVTWKQRRVRLNSIEKAKLFLKGLEKDLERGNKEGEGGEDNGEMEVVE